jgi:hypothetical protein
METLEQFKSTDLYQRMLNHFDYVVEDMATEDGQFFDETRRQGLVSWTSLDIFYRIWLVEQGCKQGTKILDFGAGPNLLSKWFDIYAVDKDVWKEPSVLCDYTGDFRTFKTMERFGGGIALCSLHYWTKDVIIELMSRMMDHIVEEPGRRLYCTFNTSRLKEAVSPNALAEQISSYCSQKNWEVIYTFAREPKGFYGYDGNVQIMAERK